MVPSGATAAATGDVISPGRPRKLTETGCSRRKSGSQLAWIDTRRTPTEVGCRA